MAHGQRVVDEPKTERSVTAESYCPSKEIPAARKATLEASEKREMAMVAPNVWREPTSVASVAEPVPGLNRVYFFCLIKLTISCSNLLFRARNSLTD